jgi:gamma-glutamyl-gamma-aminobutyrate hydrolase PuuD
MSRPIAPSRPLILISADLTAGDEPGMILRSNYARAVAEAGGLALVLPADPAQLADALDLADGVLISGTAPGTVADPARRTFERSLIERALALAMPMLGICHGMQMIGETLGGRVQTDDPALLADVSLHIPRPVPDMAAHLIDIRPGSLLATCHDGGPVLVNSLHRHRLTEDGDFRITARAPDGVIEAIEGPGFCLGLQWHPEYRLCSLDRRIFATFIDRCRR